MKKRLLSILLALALCLGLLPTEALAAEKEDLPDWYFLFAVFKNVDADGKDKNGAATHIMCSMTQDEVEIIRAQAQSFEDYMTQTGVMRAHVDVVEIDEILTELRNPDRGGSYIRAAQAAPLLEKKVDLNRYDHVACIFSPDIQTNYLGISSSAGFENGTGASCINFRAWVQQQAGTGEPPEGIYTHEYLHFMEILSAKWGADFDLHGIEEAFYSSDQAAWCDDLIKNRAKGNVGTGVHPVTWQYPPHVMRTMTELNIPSGVTSIGHNAFLNYTNLTSATIPSSVTCIDSSAFNGCTGLTSVTIPASVIRIEEWTFANCSALTRISIPVSVTSIGGAAFQNAGVTDVYYAGTEAQWKGIEIGGYNGPLTRATIHYNSLMA